jgi:RNA polymerase sigma factor (sigma-70 family)
MIVKKTAVLDTMVPNDEQLVKECLEGSEDAWAALIDKYKNLIYSIPLRYGVPRDGANEIFQQVCLGLLAELPRLRDPRSLGGWLIKVTSRKSFEWSRRERLQGKVQSEAVERNADVSTTNPDQLLIQIEREQILHEALYEITPRCRKLIQMLFYESPSIAYSDVARSLSLATGSIGFIRMRCLKQLRQRLLEKGFR